MPLLTLATCDSHVLLDLAITPSLLILLSPSYSFPPLVTWGIKGSSKLPSIVLCPPFTSSFFLFLSCIVHVVPAA